MKTYIITYIYVKHGVELASWGMSFQLSWLFISHTKQKTKTPQTNNNNKQTKETFKTMHVYFVFHFNIDILF